MNIETSYINSLPLNERFEFLRKNKQEIIEQKKSAYNTSDICYISPSIIKNSALKAYEGELKENELFVKIVANTANYIDSQNDMILKGAWNKSINEKKKLIPHLHSHVQKVDYRVGKVIDIYEQELSFNELGIDGTGFAPALIFESKIIKNYNESIFAQYKNNDINQHSIGLQYIQLSLAFNDKDDEVHYKNWNEYYPLAINKDKAAENGYFFIIKELRLIEVSAVIYGANPITPTLQIQEPQKALQTNIENNPDKCPIENKLDYNYMIKNFKF